ncbi:MAG: Mov34/MPN/PAD-1 family protein [Candidatus Syntrophoarchaeum sp.]|nr:Mov34/MPN/PAD-1 family protein [Candidatus Syntrophoarchaeum sp.]
MFEPIHFISSDKRFELCLPGELMNQVLARCSAAGSYETGGILVGKYSKNQRVAEVTAISDSPEDSVEGPTVFIRGIRGIYRWLQTLWRSSSHYYLGEWHFHPGLHTKPSTLDMGTMTDIARAEAYKCPEPILLIVGGNETHGWFFYTQVTTRDGAIVELHRCEPKKS